MSRPFLRAVPATGTNPVALAPEPRTEPIPPIPPVAEIDALVDQMREAMVAALTSEQRAALLAAVRGLAAAIDHAYSQLDAALPGVFAGLDHIAAADLDLPAVADDVDDPRWRAALAAHQRRNHGPQTSLNPFRRASRSRRTEPLPPSPSAPL